MWQEKSIFFLLCIFLLSLVHLSCLPVSDQTWIGKRESLVFPLAENACALLVLIKLQEHSVRFDPSNLTDLRIQNTITIYLYRYWTVIEYLLSYRLVDLTIRIFVVLYHISLFSPFSLFRKIVLSSFYNKE